MKKTNLLILSVALLLGVFTSCSGGNSSSNVSSSSSSSDSSSEVSSLEVSSSSSSSVSKYDQTGRYYTNAIDYVEPSWDYDTSYSPRYQVIGDKDPQMTDRIATYTYSVINQYIDPRDGLTNEYKSQAAEQEAVAFFEKLAQIICPNYNDDNARWDSPTLDPKVIEKNVVTIYDYVCSHVYYDKEAVEEGGVTAGYTPKGILNNSDLNHEDVNDYRIFTVCRGYADLMNIMLNGIGIPSIESLGRDYATNKAEIGEYQDHVWNEVYYNGRWHVIDATWESNSAGSGYWYSKSKKTYSAGNYDPNKRIYFDNIPDYTSWEDVRNYTNYHTQSHIIEARNVSQVSNMKNFEDENKGTNSYDFTFSTTLLEATEGNINIYKYVGDSEGEITIPENVTFNFMYTGVSKDSEGNYTKDSSATERSVTFITSGIEGNAFTNSKVKKVNIEISDKLEKQSNTDTRKYTSYNIKNKAFAETTSLEEVVIDDGAVNIFPRAFENSSIKKLTFNGRPDVSYAQGLLNCSGLVVYYTPSEAWTAVIKDGKYRNHEAKEITTNGN